MWRRNENNRNSVNGRLNEETNTDNNDALELGKHPGSDDTEQQQVRPGNLSSNGEVRNSNNSLVARINSNGDIRDSNNRLIAKMDDNTVRNSNNSVLGYINNDGTVRNNNQSVLGRVNSDGTVRNANNSVIGYAKGVPMKYAAFYFFYF